jgi:hypothetical protein
MFPPSPEDGSRSIFWKAVFSVLEYWKLDKIQKPSNSVKFTYEVTQVIHVAAYVSEQNCIEADLLDSELYNFEAS